MTAEYDRIAVDIRRENDAEPSASRRVRVGVNEAALSMDSGAARASSYHCMLPTSP